MRSINLTARAKVNLYLEIVGDRADGYHELVMILQSIDLADSVDICSLSTGEIKVHCNHPQVPVDSSNLAYRAAELMAKEFPNAFSKRSGVEITIRKQIPVAAGLAGGSSNAAAVLVGLDLLWELGLTQSELEELAAQLGSDIPFCISGGTAIATGRGEVLSPLPSLDNIYIVLAKYRSLEVSTPWAYKSYRAAYGHSYIKDKDSLAARATAVHSGEMVQAVVNKDVKAIASKLHNDLEKVVLPAYPQVLQLRETFASLGVLGTMMSGSGPSVFALCESKEQAEDVMRCMKREIGSDELEIFVSELVSRGVHSSMVI
jgi:4-diphosphocytidyl-2-C-methyl-D-erythritol kinase